jgi:hypothetical protein
LHVNGATHPAVLRDWWTPGGDGVLTVASFFLVLGGVIGGATVAGAEWRSGTVTTMLTWEPRRARLHLARTMGCATLACAISFGLQVVFVASLLPATLVNGSTANAEASWWISLVAAMFRTSLLAAAGAMLGVALATLGRNTAFALAFAFGWVAAVEGVIRQLQPRLARFLWGENMTLVLSWGRLDNVTFRRGPLVALVTVTLYVSVIVAAATYVFRVRDVGSSS